MWTPPVDHPLRRLFTGITEQTFIEALGLADPPLTDYLSDLLSRFISMDAVFRLSHLHGRRLEEVAEMVLEAEAMPPEGRTRREVHRHIGDFTLFWTGLYPEMLRRLRNAVSRDQFIDYCEQGKKSYFIASTFDDEQSPILRRLSREFELVAYGLSRVRQEWDRKRAA
ncbi:MAG: hypothetical protein EBV06_08575 [Planctomycetia bacterium]|nr:hypothetical protein [Planctomycetia bacterium]